MGKITVLADTPPLFIVKGSGKLELEACKEQCACFEKVFEKKERFVGVVDYRDAKLVVSLAVHRFLGKWAKDHRTLMETYSPASAILIKSALVKALVNPILKLMRLPNEVKMFNSVTEAKSWLESRARKHGIEEALVWPEF